DDPAALRRHVPVPIPAVDQFAARLLARGSCMHMPGLAVAIERFGGPAGRQLARGIALPIGLLPPDGCDLGAAVSLADRAERGAGPDRLELFDIADQHHLGAAFLGFGDYPLHLPRADHTRLVDHQDIVSCEQLPSLRPLVLQARDRARSYARAV